MERKRLKLLDLRKRNPQTRRVSQALTGSLWNITKIETTD
jgi:hypothetical protein